MMLRKMVSSVALAAVITTGVSVVVTGNLNAAVLERKTTYQGELGKVIVNPYKIAPLTAVIDRNGKDPKNIEVTVIGKKKAQDITYKVSEGALLNHDGIPVFGLYDGYVNKVKVTYSLNGKKVDETYKIYTNPFQGRITDGKLATKPNVKINKLDPKFNDRLYMVTLMGNADNKEWAWASHGKTHGAGDWSEPAEMYMIDTNGDIRWYLDTEQFYDKWGRDIDSMGRIMSMYQLDNGDLMFGQAQKYYRYSIMGEKAFERKLPRGYVDLSHEVLPMDNGHALLRVGKKDYHIPGTKDVATSVRDVVIEVDEAGRVVTEWDFNEIMGTNTFRKDLIVALDARAVCLNIDMNAKHVEIKEDMGYGDITSTGTGRNWAHINSISYDKASDAIVVSMRHQGIVKVGRDKEIDWILAPNVGWSKEMSKKVLTPVSLKGKKLNCNGGTCSDTNFDWTWTQHTAWMSPRGDNSGNIKTLSVLDNGDGRGLEQPAFKTDKYTRGVEYVIDEKNMTVKQTFEFGKDRGFGFYSAVTSNMQYETDRNTYQIFSGNVDLLTKKETKGALVEVDPKTNDVKVDIELITNKKPGVYYRSISVKPNELFKY